MIQLIEVKNPFEPQKHTKDELYYTGRSLDTYFHTEGLDIYLDGNEVTDPKTTFPADGSQILTIPHIGGKGLKKILRTVAMIGLSMYAGAVGGGLWGGIFAKGTVGALLASGAVMALGGKIINGIFPQSSGGFNTNYQETSPSYGWDTPQPQAAQGYPVGETYGECIPSPQVLSQHIETVDEKQYINLLYCGGLGPVTAIKDIKIGGTAIENFDDIQYETRLGTNTQEPISFFTNTPLDESVGVELSDKSVTRTSSSRKANALECTIEWPAGLYYLNDKGGMDHSTVKMRIEYRSTSARGEWQSFTDSVIEVRENTNSALRRTFKVEGLEPAQYDVRVTLISRDKSSRAASTTQWTLLTAYDDGVYSRPNKVLVALRILATNQLSGGTPQVTWRQTRETVSVYDPNRKTYVNKAADNPIWAAYDILHHARHLQDAHTRRWKYVVDGVDHTSLDPYFDEWESAAAYADELVENQYGEKEPRFRFDAIFDTTQKRMEAAQKAANIGHAVIVPHGRYYGIVVDRPGTITQIFGEGRTTVSSVKGSFSSKEDRARAIEVTYSDTESDFTNTVLTVRSPNFNTNHTTDNTAQLSLFGVKRRSQAYREAITALATNERQIQSLELSADIDAIVAEYGDIIGYNHTVSRIGAASGRIESVDGSTVTLDKEIEIYADRQYEIYIQLENDVLVKRAVVAADYRGRTFTVATPFDTGQIPKVYDNYAFGEAEKAVKPFRIISAARSGDMLVQLKLIEYDEAIYATELDYSKYPVIDYTYSTLYATIKNVTATENSYIESNSTIADIQVEWQTSSRGTLPDSYIVELVASDGSYTDQLTTKLNTCLFHNVKSKTAYSITVKGIVDILATTKASTMLYVEGKEYTGIGVGISGIEAHQTIGGIQVTWNPAQGAGVTYTLRCNDAVVATGLDQTSYLYKTVEEGLFRFEVQAYTADGKMTGDTLKASVYIDLPDAVTDAQASTLYRSYQDGKVGYDLITTFTLPANGTHAELYYKTDESDMTDLAVIAEGVRGTDIGYLTEWKYAGSGANRIVIPAAQVGSTYRLKLLTKDEYGYTTPEAEAVYIDCKVAAKTYVPETPTGFATDFRYSISFVWNAVTNTDIAFYEVRKNQSPGATQGLIGRTQETSLTLDTADREATLYLYACNIAGTYSYPAVLSYTAPMLDAPILTISETPRGGRIEASTFPATALQMKIYLEGSSVTDTSDVVTSANQIYVYQGDPDIYTVRASFVDLFGEGHISTEYYMTISPTFNEEWIADGSLTIEKMDTHITEAVDRTVENANKLLEHADTLIEHGSHLLEVDKDITELVKEDGRIRSTISNLETKTASQITQLSNSITTQVSNLENRTNSKITQLSDSVTSQVTALDAKTTTQIQQTANSINATIASNKSATDQAISQVSQKADSISSQVVANKAAADGSIQKLTTSVTQNATSINSIVANLSDSTKAKNAYSAISQLSDAINLRVKNGDVINQINMSSTGTTIDGKYLHVTGDTKFDNNVIVGGMIKSGAITADKLSAGTISLTNNQGIQGGNVVLNANGLTVVQSDGSSIKFDSDGMSRIDKNGNKGSNVANIVRFVVTGIKKLTFNTQLTSNNPVLNLTDQEGDDGWIEIENARKYYPAAMWEGSSTKSTFSAQEFTKQSIKIISCASMAIITGKEQYQVAPKVEFLVDTNTKLISGKEYDLFSGIDVRTNVCIYFWVETDSRLQDPTGGFSVYAGGGEIMGANYELKLVDGVQEGSLLTPGFIRKAMITNGKNVVPLERGEPRTIKSNSNTEPLSHATRNKLVQKKTSNNAYIGYSLVGLYIDNVPANKDVKIKITCSTDIYGLAYSYRPMIDRPLYKVKGTGYILDLTEIQCQEEEYNLAT